MPVMKTWCEKER